MEVNPQHGQAFKIIFARWFICPFFCFCGGWQLPLHDCIHWPVHLLHQSTPFSNARLLLLLLLFASKNLMYLNILATFILIVLLLHPSTPHSNAQLLPYLVHAYTYLHTCYSQTCKHSFAQTSANLSLAAVSSSFK